MEIFSATAAILLILFLFIAFVGASVESRFNPTLRSAFPNFLTISEIYANSKYTKWIIAVVLACATIATPPAIYKFTRCTRTVVVSTLLASLTSTTGVLTLATLPWFSANSSVHMGLAFSTFCFAVLGLWAASDRFSLYFISVVATSGLVLGIFLTTATTADPNSLVVTGDASGNFWNRFSTWAAFAEILLVGSIAVFMFTIADSMPECHCCESTKRKKARKNESLKNKTQ